MLAEKQEEEGNKVPTGLEPVNVGFANLCLTNLATAPYLPARLNETLGPFALTK